MTAQVASSTNIAWWHRFSAPTGQWTGHSPSSASFNDLETAVRTPAGASRARGRHLTGVTLRAVATSLGIDVAGGTVTAEGDLDFRGTLAVSKDAPVGFTSIRLTFDLDTEATAGQIQTLIGLTERYCVVLQTLAHPGCPSQRRRSCRAGPGRTLEDLLQHAPDAGVGCGRRRVRRCCPATRPGLCLRAAGPYRQGHGGPIGPRSVSVLRPADSRIWTDALEAST